MAEFTPSRKTAQDFNNGVEYVDQDITNNIQGDYVSANTINNVIESQLYSQGLAEYVQGLAKNSPNIENIADVGSPNVTIEELPNGSPRFKFDNLRGEKGATGDSGIGVPTSGMFWLSVADNGDLYVEYNEGSTPPEFELDENKNLYYVIGE